MVISKVVSGLLIASLCASTWAQYAEYDSPYDGYRAGPEYEEPRSVYRDDVAAASVERASPAVASNAAFAPVYDAGSYHLYHRDHPQAQVELTQDEAPHSDHKHHGHEHGTSSMSFYQKVKDHEYKFKLEQKHGKKHGSFHGLAHPYAYGGLKVHDF